MRSGFVLVFEIDNESEFLKNIDRISVIYVNEP